MEVFSNVDYNQISWFHNCNYKYNRSKTLQTKFKYCSDNIIVENAQDGVSNHGYKEWDVVIDDAITTVQKYVFVTDAIVAEHYADDTALASFFCTKDISEFVSYEMISSMAGGIGFSNCSYCNGCKSGTTPSTTSIWGGTNTKRDDDSCKLD